VKIREKRGREGGREGRREEGTGGTFEEGSRRLQATPMLTAVSSLSPVNIQT